MKTKAFESNGVHITIIQKAEFEMMGFKQAVKFNDGSIGFFLRRLIENGAMEQLARTIDAPQQIWVCLSDCQSCGLHCLDFQACCRVCVEKTEHHDPSLIKNEQLYVFSITASEWALFETKDKQSTERLFQVGHYEWVKQIGYKWNESIRLHFDNEHECYDHGEWIEGSTYRFLLPVSPREGQDNGGADKILDSGDL